MAIKFLNSQSIDGELTVTGDVGIGNTAPTSKLYVDGGALGGTAGDDVALLNLKTTTTNYDTLQFTSERLSTGTTWTSAAHRIQRKVDVTLMGYIQFGSKDDDLITFGENATEYMRIDANGKVGIGTTNPSEKLTVVGKTLVSDDGADDFIKQSVNGAVSTLAFGNTEGSGGIAKWEYNRSNGNFSGFTGVAAATEFMTVKSSGYVGIGTTSPNSELHIASLSPVLTLQDTNSPLPNQVGIEFTDSTDNVHAEIRMDSGTSGSLSIKNNYQPIDFYTGTSGTSTLAMRIDDNGFVGIGITNPTATLHVNGGLRVATVNEATSYAGDKFLVSDAENFKYVDAVQLASLIDPHITSGGKFVDGTDPLDAVYTTGNVGIGITSPSTELDVLGDVSIRGTFPTLFFSDTNSNPDYYISAGNGYFRIFDSTNNADRFHIDSSGNVGIGITSPDEMLDVDGNIKIKAALLSNQENTDVDTGTETVANVAIATYTAAFFDFVIKNGTNVRSGTVYACHDGTNVEFTETSTNDLGDTSDVRLSVDISGANMRLLATATSDNWSVKSLIRAI